MKHLFYFAVPRSASLASRRRVPQHIKATYGISGSIEHVRSEATFHLYRMEYEA